MDYSVQEVIALPTWEGDAVVGSVRKEPGTTVTDAELEEARQSEDDIALLVESGAIEEAS